VTGQPPQDPRQPPQGWYPDPDGNRALRWWDGTAWAAHTQPLPDPQPGAAPFGAGPGPAAQQPRRLAFTPDPEYGQFPRQEPWRPRWQQYPQEERYGLPGGRPPRRRHWGRYVVAGAAALIVMAGIAGRVAGNDRSTAAPAATQAAASSVAAASPAAAAKPAGARTVAAFSGSGIQNTPRFTVTATWKLVYSFSCAAFGQAGNFIVSEDGGNDFNGVSVNDMAVSKSASTWGYDDAGTHYLAIDSECSWNVKVVDEP
jgi:Protein of unknown function (DUF2510)